MQTQQQDTLLSLGTLDKIIQFVDQKHPIAIPPDIAALPFGDAIWPWMTIACEELEAVAKGPLKHLQPPAYFALQKALAAQLSAACSPSMTMEMHIAMQQLVLEGKSPRAHYRSFIRQKLGSGYALRAFFQEYKDLARYVETYLRLWIDTSAEFLHRLEKDLPLLAKVFNENEPLGTVVSICPRLGDPHNDGRSVCKVQFSSGHTLLYKPKDLRIVAAFQTLIDELNALGLPCQLKSYRVLPRDNYGWEECVPFRCCETETQVKNFFKRSGQLLCLLYVLRGTDVHYENIIAWQDYPLLIDLETLFKSVLKKESFKGRYSVLETGLLPRWLHRNDGSKGINLSGLASKSGQMSPYPIASWKHLNTARMHQVFTYRRLKHKTSQHACLFKGKTVSAARYLETIIEGFEQMHAFLRLHRSELTKPSGTFEKMAHFPVRIVLRPTMSYHRVQQSLFAPQAILNQELTQELLDQLSKNPSMEASTFFWPILEEEKRALLQGDIPHFYSVPKARDLYANKKLVLANCLEDTAYDEVLKRLLSLDKEDCQEQVRHIRDAFEVKK